MPSRKHTFSGHRKSGKRLETGYIMQAISQPISAQLLKLLMSEEEYWRPLVYLFSKEREKERVWIWGGGEDLGEDGGCEIRIKIYGMGEKNLFSIFEKGK